MARYDYICTACTCPFEVEHPMDEHPDVICPRCGAPAERHFSASAVMFKGSGFYNTDRRDKGGSSGE